MSARVTALFLGGTIGMAGHAGGAVARLGADDLVRTVPGLGEVGARLDARDFRQLPSACLGFEDLLELRAAADAAVDGGADGVVVVQGTDTIEETAYLLDLLWPHDAPLVVTGAMRNPRLAGADGPANLLAAVLVAASDEMRGAGVIVVLDDEVHAARQVAKRHSTATGAFGSPESGPLARVAEGAVTVYARAIRRPSLPLPVRAGTRVAHVTMTLADDGGLLDGLESRCDGLVVAGFGVGHVPDRLAERLGELAAAVPVVLASRTGAGPVLRRTYGFAGSETDLLGRGLIAAGSLHSLKARILLWTVLAAGGDRATVVAAFAEHG